MNALAAAELLDRYLEEIAVLESALLAINSPERRRELIVLERILDEKRAQKDELRRKLGALFI